MGIQETIDEISNSEMRRIEGANDLELVSEETAKSKPILGKTSGRFSVSGDPFDAWFKTNAYISGHLKTDFATLDKDVQQKSRYVFIKTDNRYGGDVNYAFTFLGD